MAIRLEKQTSITLKKSLKKVVFSIDWNTNIDMDIHALALTNGKATTDHDFVYYLQPVFPNGSIAHSGDIRDGSTNAIGTDVETITVDLTKLPKTKTEVLFTADIYKAADIGLDFTDAVGSVCKISDEETGITLAEYKLDKDLAGEVCAKIGKLVKTPQGWDFVALGEPAISLESVLIEAGLEIAGSEPEEE